MTTQLDKSIAACQQIAALYTGLVSDPPTPEFAAAFGPVRHQFVGFLGGVSKATAIYEHDDQAVTTIVATGVDQAGARHLVAGWIAGENPQTEGFNEQCWIDADHLLEYYKDVRTRIGDSIRLYGHSGGAGVLEAFARQVTGDTTDKPVSEIVSYGMPKVATTGRYTRVPDIGFRIRYVNDGDPVPMLPQTATGSRIFTYFAQETEELTARRWSQPSPAESGLQSGILLRVDGSSSYIGDWISPLPYTDSSLSDWLNYAGRTNSHPHNIQVYRRRLELSRTRLPPPSQNPDSHFNANTADGRDEPYRRQAQMVREQGLQGFGSLGGNAPTLVPDPTQPSPGKGREAAMPQSQVAPSLRASYLPTGNEWWVFWLDNVIATADSASKAKAVAAAVNRLAKRLGYSSSVTSLAFSQALTAYLAIAGSAGNGVKPPLNVQ